MSNSKLLSDYHDPMTDKPILFDEYGRPYIQHEMGRVMLTKKGGYYYTKD
tara:strand:+ start:777 stop:926 length:150 start_codon:yes stop_codon:yes gene_type:complete